MHGRWLAGVACVASAALVAAIAVPVHAFAPTNGASFGFGIAGITHQDITEIAIQGLYQEFFGTSRQTKAMKKALQQIVDGNAAVDTNQTESARHFDGENFAGGRAWIDQHTDGLVTDLNNDDAEGARYELGQALHALQDFYAHSNWIEGGNTGPNATLGQFGTPLTSGPAPTICRDCTPCINCTDNIVGTALTSGFYVGSAGPEDSFDPTFTKCRHGGPTDHGAGPGGGINKDTNVCLLSPHCAWHGAAAAAAAQATADFIRSIRDRVSKRDLKRLFGVGSTLAMAVDTTGSMSDKIEGVIGDAIAIVNSKLDTDDEPLHYVLSEFNDPSVGPVLTTDDPDAFKAALAGLNADDGDDCPEYSMSGLLNAIEASDDDSTVFLYTDADAKDGDLAGMVASAAEEKHITVYQALSGTCSDEGGASAMLAAGSSGKALRSNPNARMSRRRSRLDGAGLAAGADATRRAPLAAAALVPHIDPAYVTIAKRTGGQLILMAPTESGQLSGLAGSVAGSNAADVLFVQDAMTGASQYTVPVDSALSRVTFSVSLVPRDGVAPVVTLARPDGTTVGATDQGVSFTGLSNSVVYTISAPAAGVWTVGVTGQGSLSLRVFGESSLRLDRFDFVRVDGREAHQGLFTVPGAPVAGAVTTAVAELSGDFAAAAMELRAPGAAPLQALALAAEQDGPAGKLYGDVAVPTSSFVVYATGTDQNGWAFQRAIPRVVAPQTVELVAPAMPDLVAGQTTTYTFTVRNHGADDTFQLGASDGRGFASAPSAPTLALPGGQAADVTISVAIPADVQRGTSYKLVLSAESTAGTGARNSTVVAGVANWTGGMTVVAPRVRDLAATDLALEWTAPLFDVTSYSVERAAAATGPWQPVASGVAGRTVADSGLSPNSTYYYRLGAVDGSGVTTWSSARKVTTSPTAPGAPTFPWVSSDSLEVSWTEVSGATKYKIERAPDVSGAPGAFAPTSLGTWYLEQWDEGLDANTRYWYRVRARNDVSDGPPSAASLVMSAPDAPGDPTFSDVGPHSVRVSWTEPPRGAASYKLERRTTATGTFTQIAGGLTDLAFTDTGVDANLTYSYRVRGTNALGYDGDFSSTTSVTTPVDPTVPVPAAPAAPTSSSVGSGGLYLGWSVVAGAVSYRVERAADAAGAPGAWAEIASGLAGVSFHDTGLVPNTAYWYRVRATNAGGDGPPSLATTVMTAPAAPGAPTFGAVSAYTVTVVWTAPATGAATYKVERGTSPWGPFTQVAAGVAAFSVVDSAVGANVTYSYRVRGTNAAGLDGDYSPTAAVTTPIDPAVAVPAAPAAPTFSSIGSTSLYVNWTAVPGAVSYGVERAPDASGAPGAWTQIASAVVSLGFGDYGLTANSTYWYRVRATNGGGDGPQSPAAAVMTATAAPGKPSFSGVGPHTVTIAWTASPGGAASYEVERSMLNGSYARVASGLTALSFVDATVAANQAYSYLVRGVNAMGTDGDSSPAATVTTPTDPTVVLPTAPASPTFSPVYSTSLYVNWTAVPGAVSYKLERAPDASGAPGAWTQRQGAVTDLYAYDGGLSANTLYWYRLRATNGGGDGPYSPAASITTAPSAPGTPSFSGVAPYSVTVSWTAPASGASSYKVERSTSQYGTFTQLASGVASTSFVDAGVAANVTYYYRVRGTNASGVDGDYSGVSSVTTPVDPAVALPAAPGGPTYSSVSPTYLYVGWAAAAGAVSYKIERAPDAAGAPGAWAQLTSGVTSVSYFSSGLTANTAYWYRIRATNAGGDGPYSSATAVMTGPGAPGAPTFSGLGPYSVTVSWTAPVSGAATYKVERATAQYGPFTQLAAGTSGLSYVDGGVAANATYFYRVRGTNALGYDGDYSSTTSVATPIDPAIAVPPAPAAPTYSSVSTSYLYVNWAAVTGAVSYTVERAPDASGAPGAWAEIATGVTGVSSFNSGLAANTRYWYRVHATNAGGAGPASPASVVMTSPNAPGTPTFSDVGPYTVTVAWTAPAGGLASFKVERSTALYGPFTQIATGATATSLVDGGVAANVTYYYRVRATNDLGIDGSYSSTASVTTPVDPAVAVPPAPGTPSYTSVWTSYLYVNWTAAAGATSYKVERAPDAAGSPGAWAQLASGVAALSYFSSGLSANTTYWYRVRGTSAGGDGPYSAQSVVMTVPNAPGTPTFGNVGPQTVTVSWTAPSGGAASYKVERALAQYGPFTQIAAAVAGPSVVDGGVVANTTYYYRVRATNAAGLDGGYSSTASVATTVPGAPGTPTYASITAAGVTVSWSAAASATTYKVERAAGGGGAPGAWSEIAAGVTALSYPDAGLAANTPYWYRVRGTNASGDGPYSAASSVATAPGAPGTPTFGNVGQQALTVSWSAPAGGAASYEVERAPDVSGSAGSFTAIASGVASTTFADSGLTAGTAYWYRVRATSAAGLDGAPSTAATITTLAAVPAAPGGPTYASITSSGITLAWAAAAGATSYRVERAPDVSGAAGPWVEIAGGVTVASYLDTGLAANTSYWYRVRGTNTSGDGPYSTASAVATAPGAPGTPTFGNVAQQTVTVSWSAPAGGAARYEVERAPDASGSAGTWGQIASGLTATSYADSGLTAGAAYWYRVRATNTAGLDGAASTAAAVTTLPPLPGAPGTATYASITTTSVVVGWTAPTGASSYAVERAPDVSGVAGAWTEVARGLSVPSFSDGGLGPDATYWYRVRATNASGDGPYSTPSAVVTAPGAPGAPTFGNVGQQAVTLSWAAPAGGAASYDVERAPDVSGSAGSFTTIASGVSATTFADSGLTPGTVYWYRLRAANAAGLHGVPSSASSVVTLPTPPAAPGTPTYASITTTSVAVSWTAAAGATAYAVERAPDAAGSPGAWGQVATGLAAPGWIDTGLSANGAYWYRSRASNSSGYGPYSGAGRIVTLPNAPGTPSFGSVTPQSATVTWAVPTGGAASYKLERAPDASGVAGLWTEIAGGLTSPTFVDAGVSASTKYWYRVRGTNTLGLDGAYSSSASVTTPANVPSAPGAPASSSVTTASVTVTWIAAAGATSYKVERAPDASGAPGAWAQLASGLTTLSYASSGLAADTAYWYRVRGTNAAGDGPYSAASKAMTLPNAPGTPTFSAVATHSLTVGWSAPVAGATSYKVERATASSGPWTQLAAGVTSRSYADSGLNAKTKYWYRVRATNAVGADGAYSASASVTTTR